ncbi:MFS transporter [Sneathiella glossodoripedis]|uniref:MFS transporter n=1 Tax=Sneathiella glossodoripedis TaxID=418853 RepID=UPI000472714C|nr:MFS transporter [Sneathiella glossodoripedis]
MISSSRHFIKQEWRFLLFGLLLTFWSSPGQTFLISLFGAHLRNDFNLSHGEFGTLYTIATLISAVLLWKTGPLIDRLPLAKFAVTMVVLMSVSIATFAAIQGPITLLIGILFVRFMGQGMLNHIALTAMARRYSAERGRAISYAGLGFILGESLFPPVIVIALGLMDWRLIWPVMSFLCAITLLPFIKRLIEHTAAQDGPGALAQTSDDMKHYDRAALLRDYRFYLLIGISITQSGVITGLFFHQVYLVEVKGWSIEWWSICFSIFAAFSLAGGLGAGWLVDRFSARRIAPYSLLFMSVALLMFAHLNDPIFAALIMALLGIGAGYNTPAQSSMWAELYGTQHLGAIRSVANVVMVFGSALGPVFMGLAFDLGISIDSVFYACVALTLMAITASRIALRTS